MQKQVFWENWLPHPFVSVMVGLSWIMLTHNLEATTLLMAVLLGIFIPRLIQPFIARTPNIRWILALKLFLVVLWDIIICNIKVAQLILGPTHKIHPKWFRVPLETEHEQVNVLLALIITTTPGTVTAGIDQDRGDILVHVLNTDNAEIDIQDIKDRYEKPLMMIFNVPSGEHS